ncbi:GlpM family protein [Edwardsiella tarda]
MGLALKALIGALAVLLIALCARSKNYYLAGLVPMFPTFALIAHYLVGRERSLDALRHTILFGLWAIIPYLIYLLSLYLLAGHLPLPLALLGAVLCWALAAGVLILLWQR